MDPVRRERVRALGELIARHLPDDMLVENDEENEGRFDTTYRALEHSTLGDVVQDVVAQVGDDDED